MNFRRDLNFNDFNCDIFVLQRIQREYADEIVSKVPTSKRKKEQKIPQAVKNQFLKEKRLIPNMVYSIEKYDHQIIMIAKKNVRVKKIKPYSSC